MPETKEVLEKTAFESVKIPDKNQVKDMSDEVVMERYPTWESLSGLLADENPLVYFNPAHSEAMFNLGLLEPAEIFENQVRIRSACLGVNEFVERTVSADKTGVLGKVLYLMEQEIANNLTFLAPEMPKDLKLTAVTNVWAFNKILTEVTSRLAGSGYAGNEEACTFLASSECETVRELCAKGVELVQKALPALLTSKS